MVDRLHIFTHVARPRRKRVDYRLDTAPARARPGRRQCRADGAASQPTVCLTAKWWQALASG
jgi:hypothetical protein